MVSYDYYHSSEVQPIKKGKVMTQYYSNTKQDYVNINDMHHQHVWYAFKKLCDRLEELGICEHIWEDDYKPTNLKKFKKLVGGYVRRDVYELLFNKCERLEKENRKLKSTQSHFSYNSNSRSVFKLEKEVSRLKEQINRMHKDQKHIGHRYVFSNIPNDNHGKTFIKIMRQHLNKDTYNMRVRGQYLDKTKLSNGESWRTYDDGQPLSKSKCIRVYLDKKRESA